MNLFKLFSKKPIIVAHNGGFHADDVFACATLSLVLGGRCKIIRTRDEKIINSADFVVDVGGIYNPEINRFDHHQIGGAGIHKNNIPYAAFGLVWKKYGEKLCGGNIVSDIIEKKVVEPVDGPDNGTSISSSKIDGVHDYVIHNFFASLQPTWKEDSRSVDREFLRAMGIAKLILEREIKNATDYIEEENIILETYKKTADKRLLVLSNPFSRFEIVKIVIENNMPETLFVLYPDDKKGNSWNLAGVRKNLDDFGLRKDLPSEWAGLTGTTLAEISNVAGAIFCHRKRFLCAAQSKEGALKLAQQALASE